MNQKLINAVIRQLGGRDYLRDVSNHGASGGFPGFTYYTDTIKFFRNNRKEIVELVNEYAQDMGESALDMIAQFNCLAGRN